MDDTITAKENTAVVLKCISIGNPTPTNTWIPPNATTTTLNNNRTAMSSNGSLILWSVGRTSGGVYKCVVGNGVGEKVVGTTQLNVLCKFLFLSA